MDKIYRKTATIEAEQFDGSNEMVDKYGIEVVEGVADKYGIEMVDRDYAEDYSIPEAGSAPYVRYFLTRFDLEKGISVGDWIATGSNGNNWVIADDVFKKTYAELPVVPHSVDVYIQLTQMHDLPIGHAFMFAETLDKESFNWIVNNSDTFARAWLDGYTAED